MGYGDVRRTDLYAQYAMAAASQAMEDSGILGAVPPERLGVYFGSGIGGTGSCLKETEKLIQQGAHRVSPYSIPMMISNMAAGLLAIAYHAKGPCLPVVTACATSSTRSGRHTAVFVPAMPTPYSPEERKRGINPLIMAGFANCNALSLSTEPLESSLPLTAGGMALLWEKGPGCLFWKTGETAVTRKATIYAEMIGYGNTCDAYHVTFPQPDAVSSSRAVEQAMEEGDAFKIPPEQVYMNAHGTGTPVNDTIETLAVKRVFGRNALSCTSAPQSP